MALQLISEGVTGAIPLCGASYARGSEGGDILRLHALLLQAQYGAPCRQEENRTDGMPRALPAARCRAPLCAAWYLMTYVLVC